MKKIRPTHPRPLDNRFSTNSALTMQELFKDTMRRFGTWVVQAAVDTRFRCKTCSFIPTGNQLYSGNYCPTCLGTGYMVQLWKIKAHSRLGARRISINDQTNELGQIEFEYPYFDVPVSKFRDIPINRGDLIFEVEWEAPGQSGPLVSIPKRILAVYTLTAITPVFGADNELAYFAGRARKIETADLAQYLQYLRSHDMYVDFDTTEEW